jgi:hypothetical protein
VDIFWGLRDFVLARFQYRDTCGQVRNFDYGSSPRE